MARRVGMVLGAVISGLGIWFVRSHIVLRKEVQILRGRLERLEAGKAAHGDMRHEAA